MINWISNLIYELMYPYFDQFMTWTEFKNYDYIDQPVAAVGADDCSREMPRAWYPRTDL